VSATFGRRRSSSAEAVSPRASARSASPSSAAAAGFVSEGDEEDLARLARALRLQPLEDLPVLPFGGARLSAPRSDAGELDACMCGGPRRLGRLGCGECLPLELLGLARISARSPVVTPSA
jgi:hypothetical protein